MGSLFEKRRPVTQSSNNVQNTTIPSWLTGQAQTNLATANELPAYVPYSGPGPAGLTPAQLQAIQMAMNPTNDWASAAAKAANFTAPTISAQSVGADTQALMTPYNQQVIDASNAEIDRQRALEQQRNDAIAARAKAFGSDNAAVMAAETNRNFEDLKARTTADLLRQGYESAANRALGIGQSNQSAALATPGINLAGATGGAGIDTSRINGLLTAGGTQQSSDTAQNLFNYGEHQNAYKSLYDRLAAIMGATASAPHDTSQTSNGTQTSTVYSSPLGQIAGIGLGLAGLGGTGGWGNLLSSAGSGIRGLLGFADGGRPTPGQPAIVGERGPEIFVPDQPGTVIPNGGIRMGAPVANWPDMRGPASRMYELIDQLRRGPAPLAPAAPAMMGAY